ncbi:MAG: hypothetical protein F9K18_09435, partial [Thermoanaerobaculia bacterium]
MNAARLSSPSPDPRVTVHSANRWAVAAAVRQVLRRAGRDRREIDRVVDEVVEPTATRACLIAALEALGTRRRPRSG